MKTRRGWILLSVLIVLVVVVLVISLYPRGYLPSTPTIQDGETPPTAPSGLSGQAVSYSDIAIQWIDNSHNEDGFKIYRGTNLIATLPADSTAFQDTGLQVNTSYQYKVRAYNTAGESSTCSCSVEILSPPLNVNIDYVGVKFDHDPEPIQGPGDIFLIIAVSDGKHSVEKILPPGEGSAFYLNDYESIALNQRVFHTASAGDYLKVSILAYEDDDEGLFSDLLQFGLPILGAIMQNPQIANLSAVIAQYEEQTGKPLFANEDDYVGYYEEFWGYDESWGIGHHSAVGIDDFRVWLSIWSGSQPQPIPKPTLVPDSAIQSVDMVNNVEVGEMHTDSIRLENNESHNVDVTLKGYSSVTGEFFSKTLTISANTQVVVTNESHCATPGTRTITYRLFYKDNEIDSWQGTLVATFFSVDFNGWYVSDTKVDTATKGETVTARLSLSGGSPGEYTIRILRAITLWPDESVAQSKFSYDGTSVYKELSFVPGYATGESSTQGYHIDIVKDGSYIWSMTNTYPPRLRVTE